jgi:hypothetical protein
MNIAIIYYLQLLHNTVKKIDFLIDKHANIPIYPIIMSKSFVLKNWFPVYGVEIDLRIDTCSICRNKLSIKCITCQSAIPYNPNTNCTLSYSKNCEDIFHTHCIKKWLQEHKTCPSDVTEWIETSDKSQSNINHKKVEESVKKESNKKEPAKKESAKKESGGKKKSNAKKSKNKNSDDDEED